MFFVQWWVLDLISESLLPVAYCLIVLLPAPRSPAAGS